MFGQDNFEKIDRKILHFWINNPDGKGTPRVIADWWVPKNGGTLSEVQVKESLNRLISKGWVIERETSPAPKVFGLNLSKIREIQEYLETEEQGQGVAASIESGAHFSLQDLVPSLHRLDRLIQRAVQKAGTLRGPSVVADAFRGLHISPEEVEQLLQREPGTPTLAHEEGSADKVDEENGESPQLSWLEGAYGLSPIEKDIVLVALAPELDLRYERLYAYLQDDVSKKRPTVDLVLNLLTTSGEAKLQARKHFAPESPLLQHRVIHLIPDPHQLQPPLLANYLKLDEQIVNLLLGQDTQDPRLASVSRLIEPAGDRPDPLISQHLYCSVQELIRQARQNNTPLWLYLMGVRGNGQQETVEAIANKLGVPLLMVDVETLRREKQDLDVTIKQLSREAWLKGAILYCEGFDILRTEEHLGIFHGMVDGLRESWGVTILSGAQPWRTDGHGPDEILTIPFELPGYELRRLLWRSQLQEKHVDFASTDLTAGAIDSLADRFQLTPLEISQAVANAKQAAFWKGRRSPEEHAKESVAPLKSAPQAENLYAAAREQCGHELTTLTQKISPIHSWSDLILPKDAVAQLREVCSQVVHRRHVLEEWGFGQKLSLGKGVNALFAGPSGTGKTSAAEIIAQELGLDLYKIDLSRVVSKYIGETEKNCDQIFRAAKRSNAILFFDEADALWGKRSEVKDSHDRYANLEIAFLLQKMDEYEGIAILATNLRKGMDEALIRRLQFIVEFPFPNEADRLKIWKLFLEDNQRSPKHSCRPKVRDIDYDWLARQVRVAGGNIKNIVLAAAYLAAASEKDDRWIEMEHLIQAIRREYQKIGKVLSESDLTGYREHPETTETRVTTPRG